MAMAASRIKKLVVETLDGDRFEGETFDEICFDLMPGYEEEDEATQWHMRHRWARVMMRRMRLERGVAIEALDDTSSQSLIETAAQRSVIYISLPYRTFVL